MQKPASIVFLLVGILGFTQAIAPNEMLLGIFHVNIAHLFSGVVGLGCGLAGVGAARLYFRIFGIVFDLIAVLGFAPVRPTESARITT